MEDLDYKQGGVEISTLAVMKLVELNIKRIQMMNF